jgi:hypothetical protein
MDARSLYSSVSPRRRSSIRASSVSASRTTSFASQQPDLSSPSRTQSSTPLSASFLSSRSSPLHAPSHLSTGSSSPGGTGGFSHQQQSRDEDEESAIFERDIESTESISSLLGASSAAGGGGGVTPPVVAGAARGGLGAGPPASPGLKIHHPIARVSATQNLFPTVLDDGTFSLVPTVANHLAHSAFPFSSCPRSPLADLLLTSRFPLLSFMFGWVRMPEQLSKPSPPTTPLTSSWFRPPAQTRPPPASPSVNPPFSSPPRPILLPLPPSSPRI